VPIASEEEERDRERGAMGGRDETLPSGSGAKCWSGDGRSLLQKVGRGHVAMLRIKLIFRRTVGRPLMAFWGKTTQ